MEIELKPCPFCGGKAKSQQYDGGGFEPSSAMIDCDSCSICSTDWQPAAKLEDSLQKATQLWNTRTMPATDQPVSVDLEAAARAYAMADNLAMECWDEFKEGYMKKTARLLRAAGVKYDD